MGYDGTTSMKASYCFSTIFQEIYVHVFQETVYSIISVLSALNSLISKMSFGDERHQ